MRYLWYDFQVCSVPVNTHGLNFILWVVEISCQCFMSQLLSMFWKIFFLKYIKIVPQIKSRCVRTCARVCVLMNKMLPLLCGAHIEKVSWHLSPPPAGDWLEALCCLEQCIL